MSDDLKIGEVAKALGVSIPTVRRAAQRGELRSWRTPGGHVRFTDTDVRIFRAIYMADGPSS